MSDEVAPYTVRWVWDEKAQAYSPITSYTDGTDGNGSIDYQDRRFEDVIL